MAKILDYVVQAVEECVLIYHIKIIILTLDLVNQIKISQIEKIIFILHTLSILEQKIIEVMIYVVQAVEESVLIFLGLIIILILDLVNQIKI